MKEVDDADEEVEEVEEVDVVEEMEVLEGRAGWWGIVWWCCGEVVVEDGWLLKMGSGYLGLGLVCDKRQ